jgi:hypothetical protein
MAATPSADPPYGSRLDCKNRAGLNIFNGSVTEDEKHEPTDQALESGRFSDQNGFHLGLVAFGV